MRGLGAQLLGVAVLVGACRAAPSTADAGASTSETHTQTSTDTSESDENGFVPPDPDVPPECDIFEQDCGDGQKCVPWMDPEGLYWLGFTCVPVLGDRPVGEPCTFNLDDSSDDCDATSSCFSFSLFDGETAGWCHAFCTNSADDPRCAPDKVCLIGNGHPAPVLCIPECDPLAQDCDMGLGCYFLYINWFICVASQGVGVGEACSATAECEPGHMCVNAACDAPCCTPFCALSLGDGPCAALPGTSCVAFFEPGTAPPSYQDVGVCVVP